MDSHYIINDLIMIAFVKQPLAELVIIPKTSIELQFVCWSVKMYSHISIQEPESEPYFRLLLFAIWVISPRVENDC